ncbi:hypothetical protein [Cylindrospermum sp. FACHB-282]|nr:hypothetical protein [Cylindrospermum sp. FACHB-282]MBD2388075.1 hypothetical protein [Cylindrospermum sp. FACHB-282]
MPFITPLGVAIFATTGGNREKSEELQQLQSGSSFANKRLAAKASRFWR